MEPLSVDALNSLIRRIVRSEELLANIWVLGEITNFRPHSSGHRFFSLADGEAAIRSVIWRGDVKEASFDNGDRVLAHGHVDFYPARGDLQFVCDFVRPEGIGLEAARFEQLRARLEGEGLFDPSRKRKLPVYPERIGLVTSQSGAALHDVENVINHRWPLATITLAPATVQGETAPSSIVEALSKISLLPDIEVIILARGGGSSEDLAAFNDEVVVRAIFSSKVPIISGIGHDTDLTLTDLVADVSAPTPSAAAQRTTPDMHDILETVSDYGRMMEFNLHAALDRENLNFENLVYRFKVMTPTVVEYLTGIEALVVRLNDNISERMNKLDTACDTQEVHLNVLDPKATIARGFSIVEKRINGEQFVVNRIGDVESNELLEVSVQDGTFPVKVI